MPGRRGLSRPSARWTRLLQAPRGEAGPRQAMCQGGRALAGRVPGRRSLGRPCAGGGAEPRQAARGEVVLRQAARGGSGASVGYMTGGRGFCRASQGGGASAGLFLGRRGPGRPRAREAGPRQAFPGGRGLAGRALTGGPRPALCQVGAATAGRARGGGASAGHVPGFGASAGPLPGGLASAGYVTGGRGFCRPSAGGRGLGWQCARGAGPRQAAGGGDTRLTPNPRHSLVHSPLPS